MIPLTQQLEDKKKELEQDKALGIGNRIYRLQAEIAILEQAIAEMQKQRQKISDLIDKFQIELYQEMKHDSNLLFTSLKAFIKNPKLFEKLNQPKTEQ